MPKACGFAGLVLSLLTNKALGDVSFNILAHPCLIEIVLKTIYGFGDPHVTAQRRSLKLF